MEQIRQMTKSELCIRLIKKGSAFLIDLYLGSLCATLPVSIYIPVSDAVKYHRIYGSSRK